MSTNDNDDARFPRPVSDATIARVCRAEIAATLDRMKPWCNTDRPLTHREFHEYVAAALEAAAPADPREQGAPTPAATWWLIEDDSEPPVTYVKRYLPYGGLALTKDVGEAVRFHTREEAETVINDAQYVGPSRAGWVAREHEWVDAPTTAEVTDSGHKQEPTIPPPSVESDGELLARLGTDSSKWAHEFRLKAKALGYSDMDGGWLIGWFANAIMAGWDHANWKRDAEQAAPTTAEVTDAGYKQDDGAATSSVAHGDGRTQGRPQPCPHVNHYACDCVPPTPAPDALPPLDAPYWHGGVWKLGCERFSAHAAACFLFTRLREERAARERERGLAGAWFRQFIAATKRAEKAEAERDEARAKLETAQKSAREQAEWAQETGRRNNDMMAALEGVRRSLSTVEA